MRSVRIPRQEDACLSVESPRKTRIRFFSRVGLYGFVAGLTPVAASMLKDTWFWTGDFRATDLGSIIGGGGILGVSIPVLREARQDGCGLIKLSGLIGVPFGLALVFIATIHLAIPATPFTVSLFWGGIKMALVCGISLLLLMIVAFVSSARDPEPGEGP